MKRADAVSAYLGRAGTTHLESLGGSGAFRRRFRRLVDEEGFLAIQARRRDSFDTVLRDLEKHLIPWAVEERDWPRFVRYVLVACNVRDLAENLDSPALLTALAADHLPFARNLAAGLTDPLRRAAARAVLADALRSSGRSNEDAYGDLLDDLRGDLDAALAPATSAAGAGLSEDRLATVAHRVGPRLRGRWEGWMEHLADRPDVRDRVRLALAKASFRWNEPEAAWEHWGAVGDGQRLVESLRRRVARVPAEPTTLDRLAGLDRGDGRIFWRVAPLLLARFPDPERALAESQEQRFPLLREVEVIVDAAPLWGRLSRPTLAALEEELVGDRLQGHPEVRAALRVSALGAGHGELAGEALAAVDGLGGIEAWLHWSLRWIEACPPSAPGDRERRLKWVGATLADRRFMAAADDLRRFLDLVAELWPAKLRLWLEDALWAPVSDAETLLHLVRHAGHELVLEELLDRVERHAATVAEDEASGFELRATVVVEGAARLCRRRRDLRFLEVAAERLLPEEEDRLRIAVAEELMEVGELTLAEEACEGIRSPRGRRHARLRLLPGRAVERGDLDPAGLYAAVASTEAAEEELAALEPLFLEPLDPIALAGQYLDGIGHHGRRVTALLDLARHTLRFEELTMRRRQRDPLAALAPLRQALGVSESDEWLVSLLPELAEVGSVVSGRQALAELQEAVEAVLGRTSVTWHRRREALDRLLARGDRCLQRAGSGAATEVRAARWYGWLLSLPEEMPRSRPGYDDLRAHWTELLPRIVAAAERSERAVRRRLVYPFRDRLWPGGPAAPSGIGAAVERRIRRWKWLPPSGNPDAVTVCAMSPEERLVVARRLLRAGSAPAPLVEALCLLLACEHPEICEELVGLDPGAAAADHLRFDLVSGEWLRGDWAVECAAGIRERALARRARLRTMDRGDVRPVAGVMAAGDLDPDDPRCEPVRRHLWTCRGRGEEPLVELAEGVGGAIRDGGARRGVAALRLWLNARFAPVPGHAGTPAVAAAFERLGAAARSARSIRSRRTPPEDEEDPEAGDGEEGAGEPDGGADRAGYRRAEERWHREWGRSRMLFGRRSDRGALVLLSVIGGALLLMPVDLALFSLSLPPRDLEGTAMGWHPLVGAVLLGSLTLLNGVFVGGVLSWQGARVAGWPRRRRAWVRLAVAPPFVGPLLAGFHRIWPEPGDRKRDGSVAGRRHRAAFKPGVARRLGWVGRDWGVAGVFLANFGVGYAAAAYGLPDRLPYGGRVLLLIILAAVLHLLLFVAAVSAFRLQARRSRLEGPGRLLFAGLAACFLFPVPGLALLALGGLVLAGPMVESDGSLLAGVGESRSVSWGRAVRSLRQARSGRPARSDRLPGRLSQSPMETETARRVLLAAHVKLVSLLLFCALVGAATDPLADPFEPFPSASVASTLIHLLANLGLLVGLGGLAAMAVQFLRDVLLRPSPRPGHSLPGYLAATSFVVTSGLYLGNRAVQGEAESVAGVVVTFCLLGALVELVTIVGQAFSSLPERGRTQAFATTARVLAFTSLAITVLAAVDEGGGGASPGLPRVDRSTLVMATCALTVLVATQVLPWLVRPYSVRQALLGRVAAEDRRTYLFLAWTGLLPLGGVAVPLWIVLLRRCGDRERRWRESSVGGELQLALPERPPPRPPAS